MANETNMLADEMPDGVQEVTILLRNGHQLTGDNATSELDRDRGVFRLDFDAKGERHVAMVVATEIVGFWYGTTQPAGTRD